MVARFFPDGKDPPDVIDLNVGGRHFTTTRTTLRAVPGSFLGATMRLGAGRRGSGV